MGADGTHPFRQVAGRHIEWSPGGRGSLAGMREREEGERTRLKGGAEYAEFDEGHGRGGGGGALRRERVGGWVCRRAAGAKALAGWVAGGG